MGKQGSLKEKIEENRPYKDLISKNERTHYGYLDFEILRQHFSLYDPENPCPVKEIKYLLELLIAIDQNYVWDKPTLNYFYEAIDRNNHHIQFLYKEIEHLKLRLSILESHKKED